MKHHPSLYLTVALISALQHPASAQSLGSATSFTVLGGSTVTNTGATTIDGNVGVSPGSAVTGFPPGIIVNGNTYTGSDPIAAQAHADLVTAYNYYAGETPTEILSGQDLGGLTLTPGVYSFATSAQLTGTLFLDTLGDPNAVFHFQIGTTFTTANLSSVQLLGGGINPDIFWQVGTSVTLGIDTAFTGNILAQTSITLTTGATISAGRALAIDGAVTLDSNTVSNVAAAPAELGNYWKGGTDNLWSQANWSTDESGADDTNLEANANVVFSVTGTTPANQDTLLNYDAKIDSLTVNDSAAVSISGPNTLTISGTGDVTGININSGAGLATIATDVILAGESQTITVNNEAGLVMTGVIGGSIGLVKSGTGQLTLTGNETYTGATSITSGTLQLGDGTTAGTSIASSGTVIISGSTGNPTLALNLSDGAVFINDVENDGLMTAIQAGTTTLSGIVSGTGSFTQAGSGVSILTGANSYTGVTLVSDGTLQVGDGAAIGASIDSSSEVLVSDGATLAVNLANGESFTSGVANDGLVTTIASGTNTLSGVISGSGDFTQAGSGVSILTAANSYTGVTLVSDGTLQVGDGAAIGASIDSSSEVLVSDGATLAVNLANGESFTSGVANDGLVTTIASGTNTLSGVISGSGDFTQAGSGVSILTAANSYTGVTLVSDGTLQVGDGAAIGASIDSSSEVLVSNGATLAVNLANGESFTSGVANDGLVTTIASGTNTLSGVISGSGDFTQAGSGVSILTGANSYTGVTLVSDGTLQVGDGAAIGASIDSSSAVIVSTESTLAVNLANGESFTSGVANDGLVTTIASGTNTLSGVISGNGEFTQAGSGVTILTGVNSYTGLTRINRGALLINGAVAGNVQVNRGTLGGNGTIYGNVNAINDSVVNPGNPGAPAGKLSVGGNYTQGKNATFVASLVGPSTSNLLAVAGRSRLNGTLAVNYVDGFKVGVGEEFVILTSANGVSGKYKKLIDPNATGTLLTLGVIYEANAVLLKLVQGSFQDIPDLTPNQDAVGGALDDLANNNQESDLIEFLNGVQIDQLPGQYNLLIPVDFAPIFDAGFSTAQQDSGNIERRLEEIRDNSRGYGESEVYRDESQATASTSAKDGKSMIGKSGVALADEPIDRRWGFYINGMGQSIDVESTAQATGSDFITGGGSIGADYRLGNHLVLGLTGGYTNTNSNGVGDGKIEINSVSTNAYASLFGHGFYLNGMVGGAVSSYRTKRESIGGLARGDTDGTSFTGMIGTGYEHRVGRLTFGPIAALQYTSVSIDGFTENGSLAPLNVSTQSENSLKSRVGARASYAWKVGSVIITPEVRAQWQHEFQDDSRSISSSFAEDSTASFSVNGPQIGRDSLILDAGAAVQLSPRTTVYAYYTGDIGAENYSSQAVNAGVRIQF